MHALDRPLGALLLLGAAIPACAVTTSTNTADGALGQDVPPDAVSPDVPGDVPRDDRAATDVPLVFEDLPGDVPVDDAGVCRVEPPARSAVCPATTCGNGVRDRCMQCNPCGRGGPGIDAGPPPPWDAGVCCVEVTEACDGADLGAGTCASLGYRGGTLGCDSTCGHDTRACDACADPEARGICGRAAVSSLNAQDLALAVSGDRVALAWVEGSTHVGVALLDRALNVVRSTPCAGFAGARRVALTATRGGFLLAVEVAGGVRLNPLTLDGTLGAQGATITDGYAPLLAPGPAGDALLVYTDDGATTRAVRATPEGAVTRTQATLFTGVTEPEYGSATRAGDGWLVAMRVRGVEVVRVGLDLSVGATQRPAGSDTEYPQVVGSGSRAAMTWSSFGGATIAVQIAELTPTGALAGPVRTFASPVSATRYFNVAPVAAVGEDLAVLLGTHTGRTGASGRLDLLRENALPLMRATTPRPVTQSPEAATHYRVAALESTAVVAWIGEGTPRRIGLARLTP